MTTSILTSPELAIGAGGLGMIHLTRTLGRFQGREALVQSCFPLALMSFGVLTLAINYYASDIGLFERERVQALPFFFLGAPLGHWLMRIFMDIYPENTQSRRALELKGGLLVGLCLFTAAHLGGGYLAEPLLYLGFALLTLVVTLKFDKKSLGRLITFMLMSNVLFFLSFFLSSYGESREVEVLAIVFACVGFALALRWASYLLEFLNKEKRNEINDQT